MVTPLPPPGEAERRVVLHNLNPPTTPADFNQALALLRKSRNDMLLLLESTGEGIYGIDVHGACTFINKAAAGMLGYAPEAVLGKSMHELIHHSRPDGSPYPISECPIYRAFREQRGCVIDEEVLWRRDGTSFPAAYSSYPIMEQGVIKGAVVTFSDITERKRADEAVKHLNLVLQQQAAELSAMNAELESFSDSISHDLHAPLRHIDGFAELLLTETSPPLGDEGRQYLELIRASAQRMGCLIDDLLTFAKAAGKELSWTTVNLDSLVQGVLDELRPDLQGRDIVWHIRRLPEVQGDPSMIRQVLVNLIANAVKYTRPRAPASIEVGCASEATNEVIVFVRDNGVGFEMREAAQIFGAFRRLHSASEFEGTGLGLAHVRRIIHRHGGRTWAEGAVNAGATFYVALPRGR